MQTIESMHLKAPHFVCVCVIVIIVLMASFDKFQNDFNWNCAASKLLALTTRYVMRWIKWLIGGDDSAAAD